MKDLNSGLLEKDGSVTVKMIDHKSYYLYGAVVLTLRHDVFALVTAYARHLRQSIMRDVDEQNVFLKANGNRQNVEEVWVIFSGGAHLPEKVEHHDGSPTLSGEKKTSDSKDARH